MNTMKTHKKIFLLLFFCGVYIVFWWWFFHARHVSIDDDASEVVEEVTEASHVPAEAEKSDGKDTFGDLGTFWVTLTAGEETIEAPIIEGVTDEKLAQGVGHHKTTALPNRDGGNVVLSGHRWKFGKNPAYTVFEDLDTVENGDHITVHYSGDTYVYEVYDRETVDDSAIEILSQDVSEPILTLYTCTPKYTALKRLVVRARLIKD